MQVVTSPRNALLKEVRKAALRGSLTDSGLCVAEGFHLLDEALRSRCEIHAVIAAERALPQLERQAAANAAGLVKAVPDAVFETLASTEATQGVIALVRPPSWTFDDLFHAPALVVALDGVQDPGNAGAVIRAAEAFGATGVLLLKGSVNPYNPKCLRASAGSVFRVPLTAAVEEEQFIMEVDRRTLDLYALSPASGLDIAACPLERDCVLVAGSEGHGVRKSLGARASAVRIPTLAVESLNAAMASGIALYEARRKRMVQRTAEP